jgi:1-aminocyclopropane-1-carboxylate deaminase/D-cysteine desulfhydrase-like pyridoxal-dependent ACC family enzyme
MLNFYENDPIARILADQPRIRLFNQPSPIIRLRHLELHLKSNVSIFIKRDDLLWPFGGNKIRYLEFVLGQFEKSGCDCLVHGGGLTSNYLSQLAMIGATKGIEVHLAIGAQRPNVFEANQLVQGLCGANLHFIETDVSQQGNADSKKILAQKLRENGRKPFVIDYPNSNNTAYLGYMDCMREILQQSHASDTPFSHIVLCSGWHSYLGLRIGADITKSNCHITGFRPVSRGETWLSQSYPDFNLFLLDKINEFSEFLGIQLNTSGSFDLSEEQVGLGYAKYDQKTFEAISLLASKEGILLDPIYTGKAFTGLLARLSQGFFPPNSSVLFLHTGGVINLFSYKEELSNSLSHSSIFKNSAKEF